MNDTLKTYGSIESEIMNRYFVVAMCFKRQPRWRRLQTILAVRSRNCTLAAILNLIAQEPGNEFKDFRQNRQRFRFSVGKNKNTI